ncbi:MAG: bifunctional riboflavin kinase/FAD synthetase [Geminicoccaceae bacterium]|nr:MAG: bifunctional riboflavin kinase/FAD synthetase [Geminicoccaceae bacterium]
MLIVRGHRRVADAARGAAVALGNFDGVHKGHRAVVERARAAATALGVPLGVVTFRPHPREFFDPIGAPERLGGFKMRMERLRTQGVARLYVVGFNDALRRMSAEDFVEHVLVRGLGVRHVVVGDGFRFGHRRQGDAALLTALGEHHGFGVEALPAVAVDGIPASSTRIRQALADGELTVADHLLGRPYQLDAVVVEGDKIGRTLGYPTANLRVLGRRILLPRTGVYATRLRLPSGEWADGATNLGWRPVFHGQDLRLETYLFDRDVDLYGQRVRLAWHRFLRDERNFDGIDALKAQMAADCDEARRLLATTPPVEAAPL